MNGAINNLALTPEMRKIVLAMDEQNPSNPVRATKNQIFWSFNPVNQATREADLFIYDVISATAFWGDEVTPMLFQQQLNAVKDADILNIHINSPGGNVFAASAIYALLLACPATKHVYVDGLAASAASFLAMIGTKRYISLTGMFMVHKPLLSIRGNAHDLAKAIDFLDKVESTLVEAYSRTTKLPTAELATMLAQETWMTGQEAMDKGFATDLIESEIAAHYDPTSKTLELNGAEMSMGTFNDFEKFFTSTKGESQMDNLNTPGAVTVEATATQTPATQTPAAPVAVATPATVENTLATTLEASLQRMEATIASLATSASTNAEVAATVTALKADAAAMQGQLTEMRTASVKAAVSNDLKSFEGLGIVQTEAVLNSFVAMKQSSPEGYAVAMEVLQKASAANAPLTQPTGTSAETPATPEAENKVDAFQEAIKAEMTASNVSYTQAVNNVVAKNPEMYTAYKESLK